MEYYAKILDDKRREWGCIYSTHAWPHDGGNKQQGLKVYKRSDLMAGLGFPVVIVPRGDVQDGIDETRRLLKRCWFDRERCDVPKPNDAKLNPSGIAALKAYRKEWDENKATWKPTPLHNWASNGADAFRTGAMFRPATKWATGALPAPQLAIV